LFYWIIFKFNGILGYDLQKETTTQPRLLLGRKLSCKNSNWNLNLKNR